MKKLILPRSPLTAAEQRALSQHLMDQFQGFAIAHPGRNFAYAWSRQIMINAVQCLCTAGGGISEDEAADMVRQIHQMTTGMRRPARARQ